MVAAILNSDLATQFPKRTFLTPKCCHTPKWKLASHLFFKLACSNRAWTDWLTDRWMDGISTSPFSTGDNNCRGNKSLLFQQELSFEVDGAKSMKVLCVAQSDGQDSVLGKTSVEVQKQTFSFSILPQRRKRADKEVNWEINLLKISQLIYPIRVNWALYCFDLMILKGHFELVGLYAVICWSQYLTCSRQEVKL